jgi:hypothetical protein
MCVQIANRKKCHRYKNVVWFKLAEVGIQIRCTFFFAMAWIKLRIFQGTLTFLTSLEIIGFSRSAVEIFV